MTTWFLFSFWNANQQTCLQRDRCPRKNYFNFFQIGLFVDVSTAWKSKQWSGITQPIPRPQMEKLQRSPKIAHCENRLNGVLFWKKKRKFNTWSKKWKRWREQNEFLLFRGCRGREAVLLVQSRVTRRRQWWWWYNTINLFRPGLEWGIFPHLRDAPMGLVKVKAI